MNTWRPPVTEDGPRFGLVLPHFGHRPDAGSRQPHGQRRSGRFETIEDLAGRLIAGSPEECVREVRGSLEAGVRRLIFDLRLVFDDFEEQLDLLAAEVLPAVR